MNKFFIGGNLPKKPPADDGTARTKQKPKKK